MQNAYIPGIEIATIAAPIPTTCIWHFNSIIIYVATVNVNCNSVHFLSDSINYRFLSEHPKEINPNQKGINFIAPHFTASPFSQANITIHLFGWLPDFNHQMAFEITRTWKFSSRFQYFQRPDIFSAYLYTFRSWIKFLRPFIMEFFEYQLGELRLNCWFSSGGLQLRGIFLSGRFGRFVS